MYIEAEEGGNILGLSLGKHDNLPRKIGHSLHQASAAIMAPLASLAARLLGCSTHRDTQSGLRNRFVRQGAYKGLVRCDEAVGERVPCQLRRRMKIELGHDLRLVILDGLR